MTINVAEKRRGALWRPLQRLRGNLALPRGPPERVTLRGRSEAGICQR
jgi:hypothetical protein